MIEAWWRLVVVGRRRGWHVADRKGTGPPGEETYGRKKRYEGSSSTLGSSALSSSPLVADRVRPPTRLVIIHGDLEVLLSDW